MLIRTFIISILIILFNIANAEHKTITSLPKQELVPGGVAILEIPSDTKSVTYNKKPVFISEYKNNKYAIIGIPLKLEDKIDKNPISQNIIIIKTNNKTLNKSFRVAKTNYPTSSITIKNTQMVKPDHTNLKRILEDQKLILDNYNSYNNFNNNISSLLIKKPTKGIASSSFGSRRVINNIKKNSHKGMDIAAAKGSPIYSPLPGKVILAKNLFLPGNTVIVDHGNGLKTLYAHLDKVNVKQNQLISKNYKIGTVGNTGRVTGPHLHWSVILNGEAVNPSLFLMKQKS